MTNKEVGPSRIGAMLSAAVVSAVMLVSASASAGLINNSGGTGAGGQATTTGTSTTQILPQSSIFDHGFFRSGDGVGSETNSANGNQNVIIQPHNAWVTPNQINGNTEGAFWISHDVGTGANGNVTVPITASCGTGLGNCDANDISVSFIEVQGLLAGEYTIRIDTYQTSGGSNATGGNPFGVLYSGGLSSVNAVPEPGALALFAIGLAGLGFAARRRVAA